jgi:hypothetical protein
VKGENLRAAGFAQLEGEAGFDAMLLAGLDAAAAAAFFCAMLDTQAERGEGLANCLRRTQELAAGSSAGAALAPIRRGRRRD